MLHPAAQHTVSWSDGHASLLTTFNHSAYPPGSRVQTSWRVITTTTSSALIRLCHHFSVADQSKPQPCFCERWVPHFGVLGYGPCSGVSRSLPTHPQEPPDTPYILAVPPVSHSNFVVGALHVYQLSGSDTPDALDFSASSNLSTSRSSPMLCISFPVLTSFARARSVISGCVI